MSKEVVVLYINLLVNRDGLTERQADNKINEIYYRLMGYLCGKEWDEIVSFVEKYKTTLGDLKPIKRSER